TAARDEGRREPKPMGRGPKPIIRDVVGTGIAAMSEEGSGILSGDAVERGSECLFQSLDGARGDPAEVGFHLGPARLDRAQVGAVAGQIAIGKAGSIEHRLHLRWGGRPQRHRCATLRVVGTCNKGAVHSEHYHDWPGYSQIRLPDPWRERDRKSGAQA